MTTEYIDMFNFALHLILFITKIYLVYKFTKQIGIITTPKNSKMVVYSPLATSILLFCVIYLYCEAYFLYNFYEGIDLYFYEYVAILDQIIFTSLVLYYFIKGEKNNGSENKD